jgi:hypothetical protein
MQEDGEEESEMIHSCLLGRLAELGGFYTLSSIRCPTFFNMGDTL